MPSRRAFIQGGIALSALAANLGLVRIARAVPAGGDGRAVPLLTVLFDEGFADARAFGAAAAELGAPVRAVGHDIGSAWINTLEPRLKTRPAAIAGLTAAAPLFCLEYLARDYGLRVVYRIEHVPLGTRRCTHALTGPGPLAGSVHALDAAGERWAERAAEFAVRCPRDLRSNPAIALLDLAGRREDALQPLYSWLLAPASRAGAASRVGAASGREDQHRGRMPLLPQ